MIVIPASRLSAPLPSSPLPHVEIPPAAAAAAATAVAPPEGGRKDETDKNEGAKEWRRGGRQYIGHPLNGRRCHVISKEQGHRDAHLNPPELSR